MTIYDIHQAFEVLRRKMRGDTKGEELAAFAGVDQAIRDTLRASAPCTMTPAAFRWKWADGDFWKYSEDEEMTKLLAIASGPVISEPLYAAPVSPSTASMGEPVAWQYRYRLSQQWADLGRTQIDDYRSAYREEIARGDILLRPLYAAPVASSTSPSPALPAAWIDFADNGNIRFWTNYKERAEQEKERGRHLRMFTLGELVALAAKAQPSAAMTAEPAHRLAFYADWIEQTYGDLPADKYPGPPTTIVQSMRHDAAMPNPVCAKNAHTELPATDALREALVQALDRMVEAQRWHDERLGLPQMGAAIEMARAALSIPRNDRLPTEVK